MGIPFPEEYGGGGADTLSYALAVEELARVDSSVCDHDGRPHLARDDADLPLGHRRAEGRLAAAALQRREARRLRADRAGGRLGRRQHPDDAPGSRTASGWSTAPSSSSPTPGTDISGCVTITAVTGQANGTQGDLQHHRPERDARLRARRALPEDGLERLRHAAAHLRRLPRARGEPARPPRRRLQAVPADPRRRPHRRRGDGRRARPGGARRGDLLREGAPGLRPADRASSRRSRRRSPTSRPRSRRPGCSSTAPRCSRTAASPSPSPPPRRS